MINKYYTALALIKLEINFIHKSEKVWLNLHFSGCLHLKLVTPIKFNSSLPLPTYFLGMHVPSQNQTYIISFKKSNQRLTDRRLVLVCGSFRITKYNSVCQLYLPL